MRETLEKINKEIADSLEAENFKANKALDLYKYNSKEYRVDFIIDLKRKSSSYSHHLKFKFTNKLLEKKFKEFDNKLREKNGGLVLNFNRSSLEITDWKSILKKHGLDIPSFWFTYFSDIEEIDDWQGKYKTFSGLVVDLKNKLQEPSILKEYLLDNYSPYHLRMYMCMAYLNDENLSEAYKTVMLLSKDYLDHRKKELEDFYGLLLNQ